MLLELKCSVTEHALNEYVPMLIKTAGINKHITFHGARHSCSSSSLKKNDLQNLNLRQVTI